MISELDLSKMYNLTDLLRKKAYAAMVNSNSLKPEEAYEGYLNTLMTLKEVNLLAKDINIKLEQDSRNG